MNEPLNTRLIPDPPDEHIHVYGMSKANRATLVIAGIVSFCLAGLSFLITLNPQIRAGSVNNRGAAAVGVITAIFFLALGFVHIRSVRSCLIISDSRIVVVGLAIHAIPFTEIRGRRVANTRGGSAIYLIRRDKPRVLVRESWFQLDDFYRQWRASVYDLDEADRLKRKAEGKPRMMDWFHEVGDGEQHPAIGGPDPTDAPRAKGPTTEQPGPTAQRSYD